MNHTEDDAAWYPQEVRSWRLWSSVSAAQVGYALEPSNQDKKDNGGEYHV